MNPRPWPHVSMIVLLALLLPAPAWGGPPFRTNDPETVEYQHFEMASGIEYENDRGTLFGTSPHFDMNYGAAPNVQAHLMVFDDYVRNKGGPTLVGPGDVEPGVKYRFIQESEHVPMVAIYPLFEAPTASKARGLGTGSLHVFPGLAAEKRGALDELRRRRLLNKPGRGQ